MNIDSLKPTIDVYYKIKEKKNEAGDVVRPEQPLRFTVQFVSLTEAALDEDTNVMRKRSEKFRETLHRAVVGWDLMKDGVAIECNEENKLKLLPIMTSISAVKVDTGKEVYVGLDLHEIVRDVTCFLGN
jgi:hypothetical protein